MKKVNEHELDLARKIASTYEYDNQYDGYNQMDQLAPVQRNFFIRTYNDITNVYNHLSSNYSNAIKHFHIIEHNGDSVKGTHCHIVMTLLGATSPKAVHGWFKDCKDSNGNYGNTFVEIPKNLIDCYQYLIHANNPEKEPYEPNMIKHYGNPKPCLDAISLKPEYNATVRAWNDYRNGASIDFLINKYGKDFLYHVCAYERAAASQNRYNTLKSNIDNLSSRFSGLSEVLLFLSPIMGRFSETEEGFLLEPSDYHELSILIMRVMNEYINGNDEDIANMNANELLIKYSQRKDYYNDN